VLDHGRGARDRFGRSVTERSRSDEESRVFLTLATGNRHAFPSRFAHSLCSFAHPSRSGIARPHSRSAGRQRAPPHVDGKSSPIAAVVQSRRELQVRAGRTRGYGNRYRATATRDRPRPADARRLRTAGRGVGVRTRSGVRSRPRRRSRPRGVGWSLRLREYVPRAADHVLLSGGPDRRTCLYDRNSRLAPAPDRPRREAGCPTGSLH